MSSIVSKSSISTSSGNSHQTSIALLGDGTCPRVTSNIGCGPVVALITLFWSIVILSPAVSRSCLRASSASTSDFK